MKLNVGRLVSALLAVCLLFGSPGFARAAATDPATPSSNNYDGPMVTDGSSASPSSVYGPTIIAVGIVSVLIANWPHASN